MSFPGLVRSELARRCATAAFLIPAVLGAIFVGGPAFMAVIAVGSVLVAIEWTRLTGKDASAVAALIPVSIVIAVWAVLIAAGPIAALVALAAGMGAALILSPLARLNAGWCAAGVAYVGLACVSLVALREGEGPGRAVVVWLFCLVWLADTAAFAFGRVIGGPRLAPAISPAKTWAGAIAAVAAAVLVGLAAALVLGNTSPLALAAVSGGVGIAAILGDLVESCVKRRFGAKNAGDLFPGHGGMMDRVDSLIVASLAAAAVGTARGGIGDAAGGVLLW